MLSDDPVLDAGYIIAPTGYKHVARRVADHGAGLNSACVLKGVCILPGADSAQAFARDPARGAIVTSHEDVAGGIATDRVCTRTVALGGEIIVDLHPGIAPVDALSDEPTRRRGPRA